MDKIEQVLEYFQDAIKESDEIIDECSEALKAELIAQKEYLIIVNKALEKQILKKPVDDGAFGKCPSCGYELNSELANEYSIKYCLNCGQKIDWS